MVSGTVYILREDYDLINNKTTIYERDGKFEVRANAGDKIYLKDIVSTEKQSHVSIELNDSSILAIGSESTLQIEDYIISNEKHHVLLNLFSGRIAVVIRKLLGLSDKFELKTPTSITGVRGTHFYQFAEIESSKTAVFRGKVGVRSKDEGIEGETTVNEGEILTIKRGEPPGKPVSMTTSMEINLLMETEKITFETNSKKIADASYAILDEVAHILDRNKKSRIRIDGYTDNVGKSERNLKLSLERSESVKDYLVKKGISPERISVQGLGESHPIADNSTPEGRAINRRVEFIVLEE